MNARHQIVAVLPLLVVAGLALAQTGPGLLPLGGGGAGGLSLAAADARYLKLDASNDPVTGQLEVASDRLMLTGSSLDQEITASNSNTLGKCQISASNNSLKTWALGITGDTYGTLTGTTASNGDAYLVGAGTNLRLAATGVQSMSVETNGTRALIVDSSQHVNVGSPVGVTTGYSNIGGYALETMSLGIVQAGGGSGIGSGPSIGPEAMGGTLASPSANAAGDDLFDIRAIGRTDARKVAGAIALVADTGWGASGNDSPSKWQFYTVPDGTSTNTLGMTLTSTQELDIVGNLDVAGSTTTVKALTTSGDTIFGNASTDLCQVIGTQTITATTAATAALTVTNTATVAGRPALRTDTGAMAVEGDLVEFRRNTTPISQLLVDDANGSSVYGVRGAFSVLDLDDGHSGHVGTAPTTLPTCDSARRGEVRYFEDTDSTGVDSKFCGCARNEGALTYDWWRLDKTQADGTRLACLGV